MSIFKKSVVVFGSGAHAKVLIENIEAGGRYKISGIVSSDYGKIKEYCGYPLLGNTDILPELRRRGIKRLALGIGGWRDNRVRTKFFFELKEAGFELISTIHPSVILPRRFSIGEGSHVFAGCVVQSDARIGGNVVIYPQTAIAHDVVIEDHVLISGGVRIGGGAFIGRGSLIGLGAIVLARLRVGENCLIGAGALILKDALPDRSYIGIPARLAALSFQPVEI